MIHVPSSVIQYWSRGSGALAKKVTAGLASHWSCVTDMSVLSTYGSRPKMTNELCFSWGMAAFK